MATTAEKPIYPSVRYIEIENKSGGGVTYSKYKRLLPPFPKGDNRAHRRKGLIGEIKRKIQ